jgi:hypothetical protein
MCHFVCNYVWSYKLKFLWYAAKNRKNIKARL